MMTGSLILALAANLKFNKFFLVYQIVNTCESLTLTNYKYRFTRLLDQMLLKCVITIGHCSSPIMTPVGNSWLERRRF